MKWVLCLAAPWWLVSGCTQWDWTPNYTERDAGYRLVLHKPLTVRPGSARVFIQHGKMLPGAAFDQYDISCSLEVRHLSEARQNIEPDTFVVNLVQSLTEEVASRENLQVAALHTTWMDLWGDTSSIFRGWHFWLHSKTQPDVLRMTCRGAFADPWEAYPPTLEEIRYTLGDIASLQMPVQNIQPGQY